MVKKLKIGVIGGGNMGAAIVLGVRKKFTVLLCEKYAARRAQLKKKFKIKAFDLARVAAHSNVLILAVKPQDFGGILKELKGMLTKKHLVISIAAGMTTQYIEKRLNKGARVIRTMPNLPVQIGMGMIGISRGRNATKRDLAIADNIFKQIGLTLIVSESKLDAVTAVSGSGPAYVFYFVEAFEAAAKKCGLSKKEADLLIYQTLYGSLNLLVRSMDSATDLRKKVTSKGGTTEAALKVFSKSKFEATFARALKKAQKRAKELSK